MKNPLEGYFCFVRRHPEVAAATDQAIRLTSLIAVGWIRDGKRSLLVSELVSSLGEILKILHGHALAPHGGWSLKLPPLSRFCCQV